MRRIKLLLTAVLLCVGLLSNSQVANTIIVQGTVVDNEGNPIVNASITPKNSSVVGAITDNNGRFHLEILRNTTIVISSVGYKPTEIALQNSTNTLSIALEKDLAQLEQVVVVGYGQVKRKDLTGSVTSVKATDVVKSTDISLNSALQGRAAGVQVTSTEGAPGADVSISIRAGSSISASNEPLYVIDGFPQLGGSNLNINVNDVESIEILKDASATAIYGSRGANGVVIVTTKTGKAGKFNVTYDGYFGLQKLGRKRELLNSQEFAMLQHYLFSNPRNSGINDSLYHNWESFKDSVSTDWQEKAFRLAPMQGHTVSFTGGSELVKVAGSMGYTGQKGIAIGTSYDRYTARLNTIANITKWLTNSTVIGLAHTKRKGTNLTGYSGITYSILKASPYKPDNVIDLNEYIAGVGAPGIDPYLELTTPDISNAANNLNFNTAFTIKLVEALTLRVAGGLNYSSSLYDFFYPKSSSAGKINNGYAGQNTGSSTGLLNENTLNYDRTINDHRINAVAGFTMQTNTARTNSIRITDFPVQTLGYYNFNFGSRVNTPSSRKEGSGIVSYLGRVNYAYKDKYLLTASMRADGSSKFIKQKWGYFPSAAFAWRVSDENFMRSVPAISTLKFRSSYGMTGNESITPYSTYSTYEAANIGGYPVVANEAVVVGLVPSQLGNAALKWETTIQTNLGLDLGFFKNRILLTADVYKKKSKDLLLRSSISNFSGYSVTNGSTPGQAFVFRNIGDIQVKGLELDLNTLNLIGKFKWNTNFNIAFNRSKVLNLTEGQNSFTVAKVSRLADAYIVEVGQPLGNMYGYINDGIFNTQEELVAAPVHQGIDVVVGARKYKDIDGDRIVNAKDRTVIGNGNPKFFGGLNNEFLYGPLELSFLFTFTYGNDILNADKGYQQMQTSKQGGLKEMLDHWTPDNPQVNMKRWTNFSVYVAEWNYSSSYLVEDGSYLRLKNLQFAYNLSKNVIKNAPFKDIRIFVRGENLLTFTRYTGYDPEINFLNSIITPGADLGGYPKSKIYTLGLRANF